MQAAAAKVLGQQVASVAVGARWHAGRLEVIHTVGRVLLRITFSPHEHWGMAGTDPAQVQALKVRWQATREEALLKAALSFWRTARKAHIKGRVVRIIVTWKSRTSSGSSISSKQ